MVYIITGVSGVGISNSIKKFIEKFKEFQTIHRKRKPVYIKLDEEIEEVYFKENPSATRYNYRSFWLDTIMQKPYPVLEEYWRIAISNILEKVKRLEKSDNNKTILINITACYFHPETQEYFSLVNINELKKLNPEMIITFIDDIFDIQYKLKKKKSGIDHHQSFTNCDVAFKLIRYLDWRSKEIMMSRFYANQIPNCKSNHIFAIKHSFKTFANLLFENKKKVYLSHPITDIRNFQETGRLDRVSDFLTELKNLSELLSESFIAFLPTTIDEYRIKNNNINDESKLRYYPILLKRWDLEKYKNPDELLYINEEFEDENELWINNNNGILPEKSGELNYLLETLHKLIGFHVTSRDLSLVEQSDLLVIFRPFFNGTLSSGVQKERNYFLSFKELNKPEMDCFVYCPQSDLDKFYLNEFYERIKNELAVGNNLIIEKGMSLGTFSEEERDQIILGANRKDEDLLHDVLSKVLDNHLIKLKIRGIPFPLRKDTVDVFFDDFVKRLMVTYDLVDDFKKNTYFIINEVAGINDFFQIILNTSIKET